MKSLGDLGRLPLADQINAGGLIRHFEDLDFGAFIPTRSPEAIALDAEVAVTTSAQRGIFRSKASLPRTAAFLKRLAAK